MSIEVTDNSVIVVPEGQPTPVVTQTETGTAVVFGGQVQGGSFVGTSGTTGFTGETVSGSTFVANPGANFDFEDIKVKDSKIRGQGDNTIDAQDSKFKETTFRMSGGSDSVTFGAGAVVKQGVVRLGDGGDSVVFGQGSEVKDLKLDLGADDGAADVINIEDPASVKDLLIRNFGPEDTLIIGGETFTFEDIEAGLDDDGFFEGIQFKGF